MIINVQQPIRNLAGQPLTDTDGVVTLARVIVQALTEPAICDNGRPEPISGPEKLARWSLAARVHEAKGTVHVSVEEAAKIKGLVDRLFPAPIVYARVHEAIEAATAVAVTKAA